MPKYLIFAATCILIIFAPPLCAPAAAAAQAPGNAVPRVDLSIENVRADKLLYHPGEQGVVRFDVRNNSARLRTVTVEASLVCELSDATPLAGTKVDLAASESKAIEIPFAVGTRRFGCEIRLLLRENPQGPLPETARAYFSVADNFFDVGIGGTTSPIFSDNPAKLKKLIDISRRNYCNWFDVFFWAPCDWSLLVSPLDRWWSGQTSYPHDEANLKAFIADCHANGISLAAYASCNPAGPFGWERARQNPEWFTDSAGQFPALEAGGVEALDHWNDPAWRADHKFSKWLGIPVDLRRIDALDWGIEQLAASAKHYGWDAVRFDGHYTIPASDELSTRNMRRLKESVWKQVPEFRFGFNYGRAPEWRGGVTHEMREAMAGGGMYMQEGLRAWRYTAATYTSWQHYASNELRIAKQIQSIGGSYHCIWGITPGSPREQSAYKLIYGLIAGGHPAYGDHMFAPGCDNWGALLTRWSAFLWDRAIREAPGERPRVSVSADGPIIWEPLLQERVESPNRRYLIIHLVNPSPGDEIAKTTFPAPLKKVAVRLRVDPAEKIGRIVLVRPDSQPFDTELKPTPAGDGVEANVDELKLWGMLIVELTGKYPAAVAGPKFTEPPDEAKVAAAMTGRLAGRIVDPSKPAQAEAAPGERIWPTDRSFSGIGARIEPDDQAINSAAQVQNWDSLKIGRRLLGESWLGPLPAGKYRLRFHAKWSAGGNNAPWRVHAYVRSAASKKKIDLVATDAASANCWGMPGEAIDAFLGSNWRQSRQKLGPEDAYQYLPVEFELKVAAYIHASMIVETDREGPAKFLLDHIQTMLLEPYSDVLQAGWLPIDKPAGLRVPRGAAPEKVLLVKGPFSREYRISSVCAADESYQLPDKYDALYAYDAVILADADMTSSTYAQRRMLKDFVEDGGRLIILGGIATFGQGGMKDSYLEDLSPITLKGPREVVADATPRFLGFTPGHPAADHPAVFWRHDVSYRPGARVIAYAGDNPIAAIRAAGKGQVAVFTGTVLGVSREGFTAFWETKTWIELLAELIRR